MKKYGYNDDIIMTFDIETTSYKEQIDVKKHRDGSTEPVYKKSAWAYAMTIYFNGMIWTKRTWKDTVSLFNWLSEFFGRKDKKIVCYVHNLSFEFQFMKSYMTFSSIFCRKAHKVLKATYRNIEFRCSLFLANSSLAKLADNEHLESHKMEGDLDYSLIRHSKTPLTEQEMGYIKADVIVVAEYIQKKLKEYGSYSEIPMTSTGEVRYFFRENLGISLKRIHNLAVRYTAPTKELQNLLIKAYTGAYTHANYLFVGEILKDLGCIDIASSYPYQMCARKFPTQWFCLKEEVYSITLDFFKKYPPSEYAICGTIELYYPRTKHCHSIISQHKCIHLSDDYIEDNGRIAVADFLELAVTEIDIMNICDFYDFDHIIIKDVWVSKKEYLPKELVNCILKLFSQKTSLKDIEDEYDNYMRSKNRINGVYGTTVFNILKAMFEYDQNSGQYIKKEKDWDDFMKYTHNPNNYLWYSIGVWVTAYARRQILEPIKKMSENAIYSDTDSVKFKSPKRYKKLISHLNAKYTTLFNEAMKYHGFSVLEYTFFDKHGVQHLMGIFDDERPYKRFKTLGSKRYIYEYAVNEKDKKKGITSDHCHTTVAGAPKNLVDFLGETNDEKFINFKNNFTLPDCKKTHTYTEDDTYTIIQDYTGKYDLVHITSGICITPADFTMKLTDQFIQFLEGMIEFENSDIYEYFLGKKEFE